MLRPVVSGLSDLDPVDALAVIHLTLIINSGNSVSVTAIQVSHCEMSILGFEICSVINDFIEVVNRDDVKRELVWSIGWAAWLVCVWIFHIIDY